MRPLARVTPRSHSVRTWPYPYRAALAVSNDVDFCRFDFFEAFMKFCNTTSPTPFGTGLGLELTSSVFGFTEPSRQFGCFAGLDVDANETPEARRIGDYLAAGWIDANHAYGDFDGAGGFTRAHAERVLEFFRRSRGDVRVFINHGDARNTQCIGPGALHHEGDRPGSRAYHADLLATSAPAYVHTSFHAEGSASEPPPRPDRIRSLQVLFARKDPALIDDYVLQDGRRVHAFRRLRATGVNAPNLGSLTYQARLMDLALLYERAYAVVLYQHWGVLHRHAGVCTSATVDAIAARPELLAGLRLLAREHHEGRLWVPGVQRLLDYALMVTSTDVHAGAQRGTLELRCDVPLAPAGFEGLTVYVDPAVPVRLVAGGAELPLVHNGPDHTGRYSVTVPWRRRENIW